MTPLSPLMLRKTINHLLVARERYLLRRSTSSLLSSLDRVVQRWLDPTSPERREAETQLPQHTGLSPEMIRHTLPLIFAEYRAERLEHLLRDELGSAEALDTFVPSYNGQRKAYGPALITQVLAGNLPGAGLDGVIFALLLKSATVVKASSSEPLLPALFARSIAQVDPDLGEGLAVVSWPGGDADVEDLAFSQAEVVLASGSDASLAAIRARTTGRFLGYGHKLSFSLIGKEMLQESTAVEVLARQAAYDVVLFDQHGCLSPHVVYVEDGGNVRPAEFADLLAQALALWQRKLPRRQLTPAESAAVRRARDEAEWKKLAGQNVTLYTSASGTRWSVIFDTVPTFVPSPLNRTVRVKAIAALDHLPVVLAPLHLHLEAAGVAVDSARLTAIADVLGRAGVSRICPLGMLQMPPLSWRHGGRPRLGDLVRWVEVERPAEE